MELSGMAKGLGLAMAVGAPAVHAAVVIRSISSSLIGPLPRPPAPFGGWFWDRL